MDCAMMRATERDGEFIAGLAAERPRLQVAEMMRIGLFAAADETRLLGNIAKVLAVSIAPRCRNDEHALVDAVGLIEVAVSLRTHLMDANTLKTRSWGSIVCGSPKSPTVRAPIACVQEPILYKLGVGRRETVLGGERIAAPKSRRRSAER